MFIKKKATSSAFQALITQHNFAVGSSGIKKSLSNVDFFEFVDYKCFFKKIN